MNFSDYNLGRPVGRLMIFVFSILLFSSCGKKKPEKNSVYVFSLFNKNVPDYVLLNEARYSDLPVPIGFRHIKQSNNCALSVDKKSDFLSYQGDLDLVQTLEFYYKALEREGWQIEDLSNDHEGLLFCLKPTKQCVVSLRRFKKNKTKVYLFVKNKLDKLKVAGNINSKNVAELKQDLLNLSLSNFDLPNLDLSNRDFLKG